MTESGLRMPLHVLYGHMRAAVAQQLGLPVVPVLTTLDVMRED